MKTGDLVRLNETYLGHPDHRNGVLYLVSKVHNPSWEEGSTVVELYTPEGRLTAFDMGGLEVVSESR